MIVYIDPFVAGIVFTVMVEIVGCVAYALWYGRKR